MQFLKLSKLQLTGIIDLEMPDQTIDIPQRTGNDVLTDESPSNHYHKLYNYDVKFSSLHDINF